MLQRADMTAVLDVLLEAAELQHRRPAHSGDTALHRASFWGVITRLRCCPAELILGL